MVSKRTQTVASGRVSRGRAASETVRGRDERWDRDDSGGATSRGASARADVSKSASASSSGSLSPESCAANGSGSSSRKRAPNECARAAGRLFRTSATAGGGVEEGLVGGRRAVARVGLDG